MCFVDLSFENLPQFNSPSFFQEASCIYLCIFNGMDAASGLVVNRLGTCFGVSYPSHVSAFAQVVRTHVCATVIKQCNMVLV